MELEAADLERIATNLSPEEKPVFELTFGLNGKKRPAKQKMIANELKLDVWKASIIQASIYKKVAEAGYIVSSNAKDEWPKFIKVTKIGSKA